MQDYLTAAGLAALNANQASLIRTYKLGDSFNYVPGALDTNIRGTQVKAGTITEVEVVSSTLVRVTILLSANDGPFTYGEIGVFLQDGSLFSLSAFESLQYKLPQVSDPDGVAVSISVFINTSGSTASLSTGTSKDKISMVGSYRDLPNPVEASNFYVFPSPEDNKVAECAFSTGILWSFSGHTKANTFTISSATSNGFTVLGTSTGMYLGQMLQFTSGGNSGVMRKVGSLSVGATDTQVGLDAALLVTPAASDTVAIYVVNGSGGGGGGGLSNPSITQLDMGGFEVINAGSALASSSLATKANVEGWIATALSGISGGGGSGDFLASGAVAMTGNLNLNSHKAINMLTPTAGNDGANKTYVDTAAAAAFAGNRSAGGFKLTNVADATVGSDAANLTTVNKVAGLRVYTNAAVTGTITLDCATYDIFNLTFTGNTAITLSGATANQKIRIKAKQDATGSRLITFATAIRKATGVTFTASTAANAIDKLGFEYDGVDSKYDLLAIANAIA